MSVFSTKQERADDLERTIEFLYDEVTNNDRTTLRAMIVLGGTDDQIKQAIGIAAVNTRIEREDKSRYAYGVLRNLMIEAPEPDNDAIVDGKGDPIA